MPSRRSAKSTSAPIKIDRAPGPDLRTRRELADMLRVSDRYVDRLIERNEIVYVKAGRYRLFLMSDIDAFIASRRVPAVHGDTLDLDDF